jgi:hypothetical protein
LGFACANLPPCGHANCKGEPCGSHLPEQAATYGGGDPEAYRAKLLSGYPQGPLARFARPEEIAEFVVAIASPGLGPVTGAALSIDFGTTAGL